MAGDYDSGFEYMIGSAKAKEKEEGVKRVVSSLYMEVLLTCQSRI